MTTGEHLAAYAAGELDADDARALEAELARDPGLRVRLRAIRGTDRALSSLEDPTPTADFSARLRTAVADELAASLGRPHDELAARRAPRSWPGPGAWPRLAAAAAVLVLGGVGTVLVTAGGDDAGEVSADEAAGAGVATESMAAPALDAGPTVVAAGRAFDADSVRQIASDERFDELLSQQLSGPAASALARQNETAITDAEESGGDGAAASSEPAESGGAADSALAPPADNRFGLRTVGDVSASELEDVARCLPDLVAATPVIPIYAELADFEGTASIIYGLLGNDPERNTFRRVELWVVDRSDCQVLHLEQVDR